VDRTIVALACVSVVHRRPRRPDRLRPRVSYRDRL